MISFDRYNPIQSLTQFNVFSQSIETEFPGATVEILNDGSLVKFNIIFASEEDMVIFKLKYNEIL
jgi:hypothetical protein